MGGTMGYLRNCMKVTFGLGQNSREVAVFRRQTADLPCTICTSWNTRTSGTLSYSRELTAQWRETDKWVSGMYM